MASQEQRQGELLLLGSQPMRGAGRGPGRGAGSQSSKAAGDNHMPILQRKKEGPRPPRPNWIPPFSWRDSIRGKSLPQRPTPSPVLSVSLVSLNQTHPTFPFPSSHVQTTYRHLFSSFCPLLGEPLQAPEDKQTWRFFSEAQALLSLPQDRCTSIALESPFGERQLSATWHGLGTFCHPFPPNSF